MYVKFKIINLINNRDYYGVSNSQVSLNKLSLSNSFIKKDVSKYGASNFKIIILSKSNRPIKSKNAKKGYYNQKQKTNCVKVLMFKYKFKKEFNSISEAAKYINGNKSRIRKVCNTNNIAYGFQWRTI